VPVHVLSVGDYGRQALERGAVGFLRKPVDREQLRGALQRIEQRLDQKLRRVLVIDDSEVQRESVTALLGSAEVEVVAGPDGGQALERLATGGFDCVVLDLTLPDMSGFDLLDRLAQDERPLPPVIVYTARELSRDDEQRLRRYAGSIIVKGVCSPERLLDEVALFLHQVESHLPQEQQQMLREVRSREAVLEGKCIMVAEDDVRNVFALTSLLEQRGARVRVARNGREAVELVERVAAEGGKIDLVLMDVMMPEMDGLAALREIRRRPRFKNLPMIALTAKAMPDDRDRCLEAGADDYVAKPLDVDRLLSLVRVWIGK
jgi:CheY-like chemotaxis protein